MHSQEKFTTTIKRYVVAFIDVMGQKNDLSKIDVKWEAGASDEEIQRLFEKTYGYITNFQTSMNDFFETFNKSLYDNVCSLDNKIDIAFPYQAFSDSYIVYFPMDCQNVFKRIEILFTGLRFIWLDCLSKRIPIRGAVEIGACAPMHKFSGIYGGGIFRATSLEHEHADWPRIVIGPCLKYFIKDVAITNLIEPEFMTDENSTNKIEFGFLKIPPIKTQEVKMISDIVSFCYEQIQNNDNNIIKEKYIKLLNYIKSCSCN